MNVIGHKKVDGDLKTEESYRDIPMSKRLKKMLKNLKEEKKEYCKLNHIKWKEDDYVFLNQLREPYVPERLHTKIKSIIAKYNLEHMTVYGFRHSFASLMSEKKMDSEVLKEIMGHSEYETTEFYYVHISEERKKKEYERVNPIKDTSETQGKNTQNKGKKFTVKRKIKTLKSA